MLQPVPQAFPPKMSIAVLQAKHPEIAAKQEIWARIKILLESNEKEYASDQFCLQMPNERTIVREQRKVWFAAGFVNPTQELVSVKGAYVVRRGVERKLKSPILQQFAERADQSGQSLNDFIKNQASVNLDAYGTVFAVVDKPSVQPTNRAEELASGMPYLCILDPDQVLNYDWAEDGSLAWFRYKTMTGRTASQPFETGAGSGGLRYVTWTKTDYAAYDEKGDFIESFAHNFGIVPVAIQSLFTVSDAHTLGNSWFFGASRYIILANNEISVANFEIARFGSTLLASNMDVDTESVTRQKQPGTNLPEVTKPTAIGDVFPVTDMTQAPKYLTKDLDLVDKANTQARWYLNLAKEACATGQEATPLSNDPATTGNPQSGVAKAYDFQDVDANLAAFSQDLQALDIQILTIVAAEMKVNEDPEVVYPKNFDVRNFADKIAQIEGMQKVGYEKQSKTGMALSYKRLTTELTSDEEEQQTINDEIDAAAEAPDPVIPELPTLPDPNAPPPPAP